MKRTVKLAGKGQKVQAIRKAEKEEIDETDIDPMVAATYAAQEDWKESFDKKTRASIKNFILKHKNASGWKKLVKMMADVDFEAKKKKDE